MNLRNENGSEVSNISQGSHKFILFDCDSCETTVKQSYRNYCKQEDGKLCRVCRNKRSANKPEVLEKHSINGKKKWKDAEYREMMCDKLSTACKKAWDSDDGSRRQRMIDNNPMKINKNRY